jgi:digeranylgeranylglycerophospholipid reductase
MKSFKQRIHDAIIVGAGPAGCRAAYLLAREGFDVLLLEEHASPGESVLCSGIVGREAFEGIPLPAGSILNDLKDIRFVSPTLKQFRYRPDHVLASVVCRRRFDSGLARMAVEAGARLEVDSRVESLSVETDGVALTVRSDGRVVSRKARSVVLATGYGSRLVYRAGFEDRLPTVCAAQAELAMDGLPESEVYLGRDVAPGGFGWAVPIGDGKARVGITSDTQAHFHLRRLLKHPLVSDRLGASVIQIQSCPIPTGVLKSCVRDRLLVVGEASGQVKTTTNGGIYYSLLCAATAAETLAGGLREDDLSLARLSEYDRRWRRQLEKELEAGLLLRRFYDELSDGQIDILFSLSRWEGLVSLVRRTARFDWHAPLIEAVLGRGPFTSLLRAALGLPLVAPLDFPRA